MIKCLKIERDTIEESMVALNKQLNELDVGSNRVINVQTFDTSIREYDPDGRGGFYDRLIVKSTIVAFYQGF